MNERGAATVEVDGIDYWLAIVDDQDERIVYLMRAETGTLRDERTLHVHRESLPEPVRVEGQP